ncbi:MAG TPA: hypothetical protein PKC39_08655 [Ferruginibacter sp.]|nr:hypothetical protein [Ferruginibacter sp.]HMP21014.1 hypothetical protein [Ferruginibacter sp.]
MLVVYIRLLVCCLLPAALYGQGYFYTKTLPDSALLAAKPVVILLETDEFIIATALQQLNSSLWATRHDAGNTEDSTLLSLLKQSAAQQIHTDSLCKNHALQTRIQQHTAHLLQNGQCLLYNKKHKYLEKTIVVEKYWMSDIKGRRFKSNAGIVFFETAEPDF